MEIQELPFFAILLLTLLPITVGLMMVMKVVNIVKDMMKKRFISILTVGDILMFIIFLTVTIELITYIIGEQPSGFSIFDFLVIEMLPLTWYVMLLYGTLVNISSLVTKKEIKL